MDGPTEELFRTGKTKRVPAGVARRALRKLEAIPAAIQVTDLREPAGNRVLPLTGDRARRHAIAVNGQWRICFRFADGAMPMTLSSATTTSPSDSMSLPNNRPLERRPIHPGEILREDILTEYDLSVRALAEAAGVSRQSMNELLRGRRAMSPEMALRLGKLFGTTPECYLNLQRNVDLWDATRGLQREIAHIQPLRVA